MANFSDHFAQETVLVLDQFQRGVVFLQLSLIQN